MSDDDGKSNVIQGPWLGVGKADHDRKPLKDIPYDFENFDYFLVMGWKHPTVPAPQILAVPIRRKKPVEMIFRRYQEGGGVWLAPNNQREYEDGITVIGTWYPWPPIVAEVQKRRKKS